MLCQAAAGLRWSSSCRSLRIHHASVRPRAACTPWGSLRRGAGLPPYHGPSGRRGSMPPLSAGPPQRAGTPHLRAMPAPGRPRRARPVPPPPRGTALAAALLRAGRASAEVRARVPGGLGARGEGCGEGTKPTPSEALGAPAAGPAVSGGREAPHLLPCGRASRPPSRPSRAPPRTSARAPPRPPPTSRAPPRQQRERPAARTTRCSPAQDGGGGGYRAPRSPRNPASVRPAAQRIGGAGGAGPGGAGGGGPFAPSGPGRPRGCRTDWP